MDAFIMQHRGKVTATLSCFDRVLFKGYLPLHDPRRMEQFLSTQGLLLKDFKAFVTRGSAAVKDHAIAMARTAKRPFEFLPSPLRKDERARRIAQRDGLHEGLICVFSILEPAQSFKLRYGQDKPQLVRAQPRCLCLYFYFLDPEFGLVHVRLQTWFPFVLQICLNGHDWLARQLQQHGIGYQQLDNAFVELSDPAYAQHLADRFPRLNWPARLDRFAEQVNPHLRHLLGGMGYYWVADQAEYATDLLFKDCASLSGLYPNLLKHACVCFSAEDVLTFLGRKLHGSFQGEVRNEFKTRWPGARIKHRMKGNGIKMYDKHGCVLRVETVINHPYEFRIRRRGIRRGRVVLDWFPMAKRVTNLPRYAEVCLAANARYLQALSVVADPSAACQMLDRVCEPVRSHRRRFRALNPLAQRDLRLFAAACRGEHCLQGFRSTDLARLLDLLPPADLAEQRRPCARVNRLLRLLRAHGLIRKLPRTRRYRPTFRGVTFMSAIIYLRKETLPAALQLAA